jgi:hypothetical protein
MTLRLVGCLFAALMVSSAQVSSPKEKCSLEGLVTSATGGGPVRKVTLRLRMVMTSGITPGNPTYMSNYVTSSDNEGKFLFEDVEPGRYSLSAERAGYVRADYAARSSARAGTVLTLDVGQHLKDLVFKMTPQGTIAGKVTDEDGDPIDAGQVLVYRFGYVRGKNQLQQYGAAGVSADGSFLVGNLTPGKYYLSAIDIRAMRYGGAPERPGRKGPEETYVTTYFPGTIEASSAAPIDIAAGAEVRGIEIRLRKARIFHLKGKAINAVTGTPAQNIMLMLAPKDSSNRMMMFRPSTSMIRSDGSFEFTNVLPGAYIIRANPVRNMNGETSSTLVASQAVTVSDQSIDNLVVPLASGIEIAGTIKIEGAASQAPGQQASTAALRRPGISLLPSEGIAFNSPSAESKDDGAFQIRDVAPEKYHVSVFNLPDGAYVKSIRFGGQEVSQMNLDLSSYSGGPLEILLSPNAADVTGVVRNDKQEAVPGVMVSLWSPGQTPAGATDPLKTANTDQYGSFRVRNLPPGEYRIVAWEDVEIGLAQDPEFSRRFESQAISLTLRENSHETAEVKLIGKGAIEAEAAKVR